jgi:hypothetical protein
MLTLTAIARLVGSTRAGIVQFPFVLNDPPQHLLGIPEAVYAIGGIFTCRVYPSIPPPDLYATLHFLKADLPSLVRAPCPFLHPAIFSHPYIRGLHISVYIPLRFLTSAYSPVVFIPGESAHALYLTTILL